MTLIYRLFPLLAALTVGFSFAWQLDNPLSYPWIALSGVALVFLAIYLIARGRVKMTDVLEKMLPTAFLFLALNYGMLLAEGPWARWTIVVLGSLAAFLSLELLFLLAFMPSRYPVNSLSHVNIAYVPFIIWYLVATSVGLMAFLQSPKWLYVTSLAVLTLFLFRTTGHPGATKEQNRRWMLIGGVAGLHVGLLSCMLPLSMAAQGTLGMVAVCGVLRARRYLYHPLPGKRQAWIESAMAVMVIGIVLGTSRWL